MKIDLHVHSLYSRRPSQWVLQKIGCPESFTQPRHIYDMAMRKGMNLVTITDHNVIDGALEIAHLPHTFVSEEITTYFPEDGCKVHVLAYGITESQHRDIQALRSNIHELTAWLRREDILHALAHPLYAVNDRLTVAHIEKALLLFRHFELNGARGDQRNQCLRHVLTHLRARDIFRMADRHGIEPVHDTPWEKYLIGGSDDHGGLNIARTHTEIAGATTVQETLTAIREGRCWVVDDPSTPRTMAHNLYAIAYQYYRDRLRLDRHARKDNLLRLLDRFLMPESGEDGSGLVSRFFVFLQSRKIARGAEAETPASPLAMIRRETERLLKQNPHWLHRPGDVEDHPCASPEDLWFDVVNQVSSKVIFSLGDHLFGHLSGANVFNVFQTIGSAGGLYTLLAPYFVAFSQFTRDRRLAREVVEAFAPDLLAVKGGTDTMNVAHFTDTFHDVNGVAITLRQQAEAARRTRKRLTIVTCDDRPASSGGEASGTRNFEPVGRFVMPEYPDQRLAYPPFLDMLNYCHENGFTHIHSATPGPVGLAALAIARILDIPISGTYHTAFPQYAEHLTQDPMIADMTWKYMIWYYGQMDRVYVSSQGNATELAEKGIAPEKIRLIPRGIDVRRFHPSRRNGFFGRYAIAEPVKLLYVGRVSREKNLSVLVEAFRRLQAERGDAHLVIVGDGPYREEMRRELTGLPVTFTGYLNGDDLTGAYASADVFVFPSTTDTFGNVILEAQASGLPVIVTDQGGPRENMIPDRTGLMVAGADATGLAAAMSRLVEDAGLRQRMAQAAREYMEERSFENAFIEAWDLYRETAHPALPVFARAV